MTRQLTALAVVVAAVLMVCGVWFLGDRAQVAPPVKGDQLGMDGSESFDDYAARAEESLASLNDDTSHFALVTFSQPLGPQQASTVLDHIWRVNAVVVQGLPPIAVGEPKNRAERSEVFSAALRRAETDGDVESPQLVSVVAHDSGAALASLAEDQAVAVVEALPADAVWGSFGVRPVDKQ